MNWRSTVQGCLVSHAMQRRNYYDPFFQASITLMRHYNIVFIENSKVGCTKVKKYLLEIDNWPKRWDELIDNEVHIHNKQLTGMIGAADLSYSALSIILKDPNYFRFGFVRNPYDRLLSAYKDKIFAPQKSPDKKSYVGVACSIKSAMTGEDRGRINLDKTPVTFAEFVNYVASQRPYDMDRHWYHQHLTMWHPFCKFDFIGQFERFSEDLCNVLTKIGAPERLITSVSKRDNPSFLTHEKFYDKHLAQTVHRKFRRDFDIYGYDPKSWMDY
jgi:hypothetical protein